MADKAAKADPELARKVGHGTVSLPKAPAQVESKAAAKAGTMSAATAPSTTPATEPDS